MAGRAILGRDKVKSRRLLDKASISFYVAAVWRIITTVTPIIVYMYEYPFAMATINSFIFII